jgi:tetratricopeptide (TPR) repeat protein
MLQAALKRGINAVEHEDFRQALTVFSGIYNEQSEEPVDGLSYYGLCLALIEKKYKPAIRLCQRAISVQFYNAAHYANATRVLIAAGNRRRAVEILDEGLKQLPKDALLLQVRERIGWRRGSAIGLLHRDNPLNIWLGKRRTRARRDAGGEVAYAAQKKRNRGIFYYLLAILAVLAYFVFVIGLFVWIIE